MANEQPINIEVNPNTNVTISITLPCGCQVNVAQHGYVVTPSMDLLASMLRGMAEAAPPKLAHWAAIHDAKCPKRVG